MPSRSITRPDLRPNGFILPAAIMLLVVLGGLAAYMLQLSSAGQTTSAQDILGARATQAARLGLEAGIYNARINNQCDGLTNTLSNVAGLTEMQINWFCTDSQFADADGATHNISRITATACTAGVTACPANTAADLQRQDYVERQLIADVER